eukprot:s3839_g9.t2
MLADGMAQLQKAMIKQIDKGDTEDKSPETVKPGTLALPMLKEVVAETSCVDVMDWMELIDGPMSDLSDSSAGWWRRVTSEAYRAYGLWSLASPLDRLAIYPEVKDLEEGKFSRLNSRAAAMIVTALHETVRQEVVARRLTGSTVRLVFRLLTLYQPGGEEEKFQILQNLQSPAPEQEASKAVLALRAWSRWLRRCKELNVQTPDPSLLARGLTNLVKSVMEKNADSAFRTSLVKSTLQIDSNPSYDKVDSYFKHLMAECEAMAVSASGVQTVTVTPRQDPRLRPIAMKPEPKTSPTPPNPKTTSTATTSTPAPENNKFAKPKSEVQCRFFGKTTKGCTRAGKCPFQHSWEGLDKKDRCLVCGGKGHGAKECPTKKGPTSTGNSPKAAPEKPAAAASSSSTTSARTVRVDECMLGYLNLIPMRYLTKKYPLTRQGDRPTLLEEVLGMILFVKMTMIERCKSKAKEHRQGKQRLVLLKPRLTLSHICAHIVIVIRAFQRELKLWGDLITFDFLDMRKAADAGLGIDDGAREVLVIRDVATKMIAAIPTESRHTEQVVSALKRLFGRQKVKMAYSDVAPEFEAAMSELRIPLDHSLPGKPNNNSLADRTNQEIINTVATAMLHAGLPAQYWSFALNCVTHNLNIEDVEGDGDSARKRMTGDDFKGKAIPFGAKVFFKPTDTRDKTCSHKFDPKGIPGVFAGYVVTTGQSWSRKYRVKEFANVNLSMDAAVPRKLAQPYQTEVIHLPKEITFPLKAEYEKMNETLEGLKDNVHLDGKEIKDFGDDDDAPDRPPSGGQGGDELDDGHPPPDPGELEDPDLADIELSEDEKS